ncbi:MAG: PorP/SprF family type IX secretion system membrane protein [Chitinophagales bacterium]|nr:PorP/SprF family type IX secretion system membrane protein [Chitinophagales bacterium]
MKRTFILILFAFSISFSQGQDIHFSQYYFSPLTLNPAHTGNINGLFRAAAIYRNQWFTIQKPAGLGTGRSPFETYAGSFDIKVFPGGLEPDRFGVGLMVFHDKAGNGALTTQSAMLSIAYHKAIDQFGRHQISLGFQGGMTQKRIFINDLLFENQLVDLGFNPSLPTGEEGRFDSPERYADFHVGAMYQSSITDYFRFYLGFALNHIGTPVESFFGETNELNHRYVAHGGAEIQLNEYAVLAPSFQFLLQSNAQEWNVGAAFQYQMTDPTALFIGAWTRLFDAAILTAGFEHKDIRMGLSYDINYSDLRSASQAQGALEMSMIYIFKNHEQRVHYERYCPNF